MADGGAVSVVDGVRSDARLEWRVRFGRRRVGGRGLGGSDGAGEGEINPGGRHIASEAERSRGVAAGVEWELLLTAVEDGAAIGVTSVRLGVFGCRLEVVGREDFGGGNEARFAVGLSDGSAMAGTGLDFATDGCGAGTVVDLFVDEPQPASLPEWFATGDPHPRVVSLAGDPQPPPSASQPLFFPATGEPHPVLFGGGEPQSPFVWDGEPHPTAALLAVEVDCIRLVACGGLDQDDLEVGQDDVLLVSFLDAQVGADTMGGLRPLVVDAGSVRETGRDRALSRSCSY